MQSMEGLPPDDLPPTWVRGNAVTQEMIDTRCPGGAKEWLYHRCVLVL